MAVIYGACPYCGDRGLHVTDNEFGFMCSSCRYDCIMIVTVANLSWWKRLIWRVIEPAVDRI